MFSMSWLFLPLLCALVAGLVVPPLLDLVASVSLSGVDFLATIFSLVPPCVPSSVSPVQCDSWSLMAGLSGAASVLAVCVDACLQCLQCPLYSGGTSNMSVEFHIRPGWACARSATCPSGVPESLSHGHRAVESASLDGLGDDEDLGPLPFQYIRYSVERATGAVVGHCRWYRPSSQQLPFLYLDPWGQLCSLQEVVTCPVLMEVLRYNLSEEHL